MNDDLLFELESIGNAVSGNGSGAATMNELVDATGHSDKWILRRLHLSIAAGKVECVKVPSRSIDGKYIKVTAYRLRSDSCPRDSLLKQDALVDGNLAQNGPKITRGQPTSTSSLKRCASMMRRQKNSSAK